MIVFSAQVIFLEVYEREAARQKLVYLVTAGLCAYFSHKVDEYGVYFFDPRYYQVNNSSSKIHVYGPVDHIFLRQLSPSMPPCDWSVLETRPHLLSSGTLQERG